MRHTLQGLTLLALTTPGFAWACGNAMVEASEPTVEPATRLWTPGLVMSVVAFLALCALMAWYLSMSRRRPPSEIA